MVTTRPAIEGPQGAARVACASSLPSYSLPRALLTIEVKPGDSPSLELAIKRVPDNAHRYCLDYERSILAAESINVIVGSPRDSATTASPFLQAIYTHSIDETGNLIRKIIQTTFDLLARSDGLRDATTSAPAALPPRHYELDPFNDVDMARVNRELAAYNICFVVDKYSFNRATTQPGEYCRSPLETVAAQRSPDLVVRQAQQALLPEPGPGVFYRPRLNYELAIYVRDGSGQPWRLNEVRVMQLENLSPIVALRIDRAAFATAKMALIFSDGTLGQICIEKGSEALGFVRIPIELIHGIVSAPARALQSEIDLVNGQNTVATKMAELIELQNAYADYLVAKLENPGLTLPNNLRPPTAGTAPGAESYDNSVSFVGIGANAESPSILKVHGGICQSVGS